MVGNLSFLCKISFSTEHVTTLGTRVLHVLPLDNVKVLKFSLLLPDPDLVLLIVPIVVLNTNNNNICTESELRTSAFSRPSHCRKCISWSRH